MIENIWNIIPTAASVLILISIVALTAFISGKIIAQIIIFIRTVIYYIIKGICNLIDIICNLIDIIIYFIKGA